MVDRVMQAADRDPAAPAHLWAWVLAGALLGGWWSERAAARRGSALDLRAPVCVDTGLATSGERAPSARTLRAIEGVGPVRSLVLARAWWERGPPGDARALEALEGIGEKTAERVWSSLLDGARGASGAHALPPRFPASSRAP